ncbi:hypothetical protein SASPL_101138 [Salvia splendens]|uniref:Proteasome assembly chaperone 2 n=1 Tax=Salvia splendens TaxID=180675 RepID=A0A8X8YTG4_SALSN|nr:hypothetical protein SASPL_101138 [Salvia splendens]
MPALSIGNVGQLAVDLLISSLKADKVGCLDDPNVLPCFGNDAYSPSPLGKLALSLEAYESSSSGLTLVQQRSPVLKGIMVAYAKNIANLAAAKRKSMYYDSALRTWKYLDTLAQVSVPDEDSPFDELSDDDYYPSLPFAALFSCFKAKGLKVTCLFCYCSEGDNMPEAFSMAEAASKAVGLNDFLGGDNGAGKWITPFSWQSVYGPPADMTLF